MLFGIYKTQSPVNSDEASWGGLFGGKSTFLDQNEWLTALPQRLRIKPCMGSDSVGNLTILVPSQLFVFLKTNSDTK